MELILAILLGIGTYHGLLEMLHFPENVANSAGWIVGILTLVIWNAVEKTVEHRRKVELKKAARQVVYVEKTVEKEQEVNASENVEKSKNLKDYNFFKHK